MEENNQFIQIKHLDKSFPVRDRTVRVVKDVSLDLPGGKFIILFGPSGSGKSTLLNMILGLESPSKGEIYINNFPLHSKNQEEVTNFRKENIGVITQQPIWIKAANVLTNVAFPLLLQGVPTYDAYNKAIELLNLFGMKDWVSFYPTELSFGQQQKVAVARALVKNPNIIIADEPTGNLDYESGLSLVKMLSNLTKQGKTVIMVTHDLNNIELGDIIVRIFDGKVVEVVKTIDYTKENLKTKLIDYSPFESQISNRESGSLEILSDKESKEKLRKYDKVSLKDRLKFNVINFLSSLKISFFVLTSLIYRLIYTILGIKFMPSFLKNNKYLLEREYTKFIRVLGFSSKNTINPSQILDLSIKNLFFIRSRALVTIGGVSIGIAFTVFLLSIGFGVEKLVISRISTLSQLTQVDVYPSSARQLKLNNSTTDDFRKLPDIKEVLPVLNLAGRVSYNNSNFDVVVFSVQGDYLKLSDFSLVAGNYYTNNELPADSTGFNTQESNSNAKVAGESTSLEDEGEVEGVLQVSIDKSAERVAVVNLALLKTLGLSESDVLNKELDVAFLLTKNANDNTSEVESHSEAYKVVAVIGNSETPIMYIPLKTAESFGQISYTQARVLIDNQDNVTPVRERFQALGYNTTSVLDTINQIEGLFSTVRVVFLAVGIVALSVAGLGMFNTLTVSLLERTKEVGIMKVIGLSSKEVNQLFLSESMMIAVMGSFLGIGLGMLGGLIFSILISIISISRANVFLNITYLPFSTACLIVGLSIFIGFITGYYPAVRATRISPLEALRYE